MQKVQLQIITRFVRLKCNNLRVNIRGLSIRTEAQTINTGRILLIEPRREKTCLRGFRQSEFRISLLSYRD